MGHSLNPLKGNKDSSLDSYFPFHTKHACVHAHAALHIKIIFVMIFTHSLITTFSATQIFMSIVITKTTI